MCCEHFRTPLPSAPLDISLERCASACPPAHASSLLLASKLDAHLLPLAMHASQATTLELAGPCNACSTTRLPEHPRCSGSPQYTLVVVSFIIIY